MNLFTIDELYIFNKFLSIINKRTESANPITLDDVSRYVYQEYQKETCTGYERKYHNFSHVIDCINTLEFVSTIYSLSEMEYDLLFVAIIYHDAVYKTGELLAPGGNEMFSAIFAAKELKTLRMSKDFIDEVSRLILATMHSDPVFDSTFLELVIRDIDLAGLAAPWEQFSKVSDNIRHEYGCYDDASYAEGRIAFLDNFLSRDSIYNCHKLRDLWENTALDNLKQHLQELQVTSAK